MAKFGYSEVGDILHRTLDNLLLTSLPGTSGASLRQQAGYVKANYPMLYRTGKIGAETSDCFTVAREAGITLDSLSIVHRQLFLEEPVSAAAIALWQALTLFCLAAESRVVSGMTFVSREDAEAMMARMRVTFDTAKDLAADAIDSACYQALNYLSGALTNHLAATARPLPQMIMIKMPLSFPMLTLSNRIYYTADRWEELYAENKTIHPLFAQRELRGLSK